MPRLPSTLPQAAPQGKPALVWRDGHASRCGYAGIAGRARHVVARRGRQQIQKRSQPCPPGKAGGRYKFRDTFKFGSNARLPTSLPHSREWLCHNRSGTLRGTGMNCVRDENLRAGYGSDAELRGLMLGGGFYGFFEVGGYAGFGDVAADAGLGGVAGEVEGFEVGDDEDFGFGGVAADEFGGGEAVHGGHGNVQEDHVGLQLGGFYYGVAAVFGFAADLPFGMKLEEHFQAGAYGQAVVCDEDADFGHGLLGSILSARYEGYFTNGARKCTSGVPCR